MELLDFSDDDDDSNLLLHASLVGAGNAGGGGAGGGIGVGGGASAARQPCRVCLGTSFSRTALGGLVCTLCGTQSTAVGSLETSEMVES